MQLDKYVQSQERASCHKVVSHEDFFKWTRYCISIGLYPRDIAPIKIVSSLTGGLQPKYFIGLKIQKGGLDQLI